jgi:hypothetical protein
MNKKAIQNLNNKIDSDIEGILVKPKKFMIKLGKIMENQ